MFVLGVWMQEQPAEKRPRSAYITFVSDMYADIAAANPQKKGKDVMTQLGVEWKKLPEQEKVRKTRVLACDLQHATSHMRE